MLKASSLDDLGSWKYWKTNNFDDLGAWKYLKAPCCLVRLGNKNIFGTCSWENEHGNLGTHVKTNTFLNMAPQAKPLCS